MSMAQITQTIHLQELKTKTSITCEQSQKLIQTMLTMSFGCVAFLRGLFPDESFVDQRFVPNKFEKDYDPKDPKNKNDSIRVKTLARGKSAQVDHFLDWIDKGATDAIRKGYLKSLSFSIFLNENNPTDLLEVYTFFFDYKNNDVQMSISDQEREPISLLDSRKMLQQLMKRFIIITQSLEPLPDNKFMAIRLLFNDNCPKDYQPPFFMDASTEPIALLKAPRESNVEKYSAGSVTTSHHDIKLKVLSRPVLLAAEDEIIEIDPFEAPLFKTPNMIQQQHSLKQTTRFVKREPSQTTNKLREFLESPQPEIKLTQAIERIKCECGCTEEADVSGTIKCASCDGVLHGSCYASSARRQSTVCFTCRAESLGAIPKHQNLKLLMVSRKLYRLITKVDIPPSTSMVHEQLGFLRGQYVDVTASVISFFFKKSIFIIEDQPRRLKRQVGDSVYQRGSSYVDVDIDDIVVNGTKLSQGRYTWSFIPKISGPDLPGLKSKAARAKKYLFEDTLENGLSIDENLNELDIKKPSIEEEENIINSSDQEMTDETKHSGEVTGCFSNLNIQSSQGYEPIESSHPVKAQKRPMSSDHDPIDVQSSQPVFVSPKVKRRKLSVSKRVIQADSHA